MKNEIKFMESKYFRVSAKFEKNPPRRDKIENRITDIHNNIINPVVVNPYNVILDGYASYLAYLELGLNIIPYVVIDSKVNAGKETIKDIVFKRDNNTCYICNRKLKSKYLTIDHVRPKCKGGSSSLTNLRCCCLTCNNIKGSLTYSEDLVRVIKNELKELGIL